MMLATLRLLFFLLAVAKNCDGFPMDPDYNEDAVNIITCAVIPDGCKYEDKSRCSQIEKCASVYDSCFIAWQSVNGSEDIVKHQGCWTASHTSRCTTSECKQDPNIGALNFCCCNSDLCNTNYTIFFGSTTPPEGARPVETEKPDSVRETVLYSLVPIAILVFIIIGIFFMWRFYYKDRFGHEQLPTFDPVQSTPPSPQPLKPVQLIELRAHGRFGEVYKGTMATEAVAVKIFPMKEKVSWMMEQDIYKLPHMKHDNVLRFIAAEKRDDKLWLISQFHDLGSLCDYLKGHKLTWLDMLKIGESMAKGLAYLHDDIPGAGHSEAKPSIAHRDFKSKNVLLKSDLTACIADFGLALKFDAGKSAGEIHGLVGTRRYMAPEVLEGAICFNRDAFLRIDMYACGLVLWELVSRCSVAEGQIDNYQLPFEEEVGTHPTLEDMQEYVVLKKCRPTIKETWLRHSGLEVMINTIEECWDQDAEARVSANCVHERLIALSRLTNVSPVIFSPSEEIPYQISSISA
ncbi:activin receptor type-2A-like [Mytilus californianus]|uniref:activin receptor type-2A-like n=1 Tax=Mytilus californianus TaxID=6549 RepID=UPI002246B980|nr:activin receptor type-2A-like [Mytilus californianus]